MSNPESKISKSKIPKKKISENKIPNKLKILCLHGFRHNSELFKKSMDSTIKKLSKLNVEFDFYDSPINYVGEEEGDDDKNNYRQWWSANKDNVLTLENYDTLEQSIQNLKHKWEEGKYDGLLGFSQGSVLAQIFAYQIQNKLLETYEPKFIVLASTFPITDTNYKKYYQEQLNCKTVIMTGSRDTLVDMKHTLSIIKHFKNPTTIVHTGGHYFSTSSETYYLFKKFLEDNFTKKS
jgi:predicted lipase